MHQMHERLQALLEPAVAAAGCELLGIEYSGQGRGALLRLYIDREDGVTVDDCERVSRQVSGVLDVEEPIREQYTLEVSSPGLDRPLFKRAHFQRFAGHRARIRLGAAYNGRRNFTGTLAGVSEDAVLLDVDGEQLALPLARIERARLVAEL